MNSWTGLLHGWSQFGSPTKKMLQEKISCFDRYFVVKFGVDFNKLSDNVYITARCKRANQVLQFLSIRIELTGKKTMSSSPNGQWSVVHKLFYPLQSIQLDLCATFFFHVIKNGSHEREKKTHWNVPENHE